MTFEEFLKDVQNKNGVDTDGYYGKQCMDLYNYYCRNVVELDGNTGADCAKNVLNNQYVLDNFKRIDNYPEFVPQKGDVAVWTGGEFGHIAICLGEGDVNTFNTIDQNWKPQQLTFETHNYLYLAPLVFLRPKNQKNINTKKKVKTYNVIVTADVLNVREGPGLDYRIKGYTELTKNAQEQVMAKCGYPANGLVKGVECTISETSNNWGKIPSGWICLDYTKKV